MLRLEICEARPHSSKKDWALAAAALDTHNVLDAIEDKFDRARRNFLARGGSPQEIWAGLKMNWDVTGTTGWDVIRLALRPPVEDMLKGVPTDDTYRALRENNFMKGWIAADEDRALEKEAGRDTATLLANFEEIKLSATPIAVDVTQLWLRLGLWSVWVRNLRLRWAECCDLPSKIASTMLQASAQVNDYVRSKPVETRTHRPPVTSNFETISSAPNSSSTALIVVDPVVWDHHGLGPPNKLQRPQLTVVKDLVCPPRPAWPPQPATPACSSGSSSSSTGAWQCLYHDSAEMDTQKRLPPAGHLLQCHQSGERLLGSCLSRPGIGTCSPSH